MSVRVLESRDGKMAALYCSTTDWAFGPVFQSDEAAEDARAFLKFLGCDPRTLSEKELETCYSDWRQATDGD